MSHIPYWNAMAYRINAEREVAEDAAQIEFEQKKAASGGMIRVGGRPKHVWQSMKMDGRWWDECVVCGEKYQPGYYSHCSGKREGGGQ